jgi:hypothetical protein
MNSNHSNPGPATRSTAFLFASKIGKSIGRTVIAIKEGFWLANSNVSIGKIGQASVLMMINSPYAEYLEGARTPVFG